MVFSSTSFLSAQSLFHRHNPCSIGSSLQDPSIGTFPVSSAAVFKPSFIGIGNNTLNLIGNISI
jgi:hypothetical protein